MRPLWRMLVAGMLLLGPAGCAEPDREVDGEVPTARSQQYLSQHERAEGLAAQQRLLADRVASRQDYEASVDGLQRCLSTHGISLVNEGWNPVDQTSMMLWYRAPGKPDEYVAGYGDDCQSAYLSAVADEYRKSTESVMTPELMTLTRNCLTAKGIELRGTEKGIPELLASSDQHESVTTCVESGVNKLYPGIPVPVGW
jgi:hypothetical protein